MSPRAKRAVYTAGGLTALVVVVLVLVVIGPAGGRLLDGTQVTLAKANYGTNHIAPKAPLEGLLRHLPSKWSARIQWHAGSGERRVSDRSIFTFWLKFSRPTTDAQALGYAIADENGFEAPMLFTGPYASYSPGGFSKSDIGLVRGSGIFPHRSKKFFLRLYQQDAAGKRLRVAQFAINNEVLTNPAGWTPQALPIEQKSNGLVFSLIKAEVGVAPPGALLARYALQAGEWSEFRFRVSREGQPAAGWTVNEILMSDGAGDQLRVSAEDGGAFNHQFSRTEGDEIVCLHRWPFWPEEPAWKLSVHFEQLAKPGCWVEYLVRPKFLDTTTQ